MCKLTDLRNQHDAVLAMADRLIDLIDDYDDDQDALPIAVQLSKLLGLLRVHFAQEDMLLYPALVTSGDREAVRLALSYASEMGGLANELEKFFLRWPSSAVIAGAFPEFAAAARNLVLTLTVRIERENRFLYPLAEMTSAPAGAPIVGVSAGAGAGAV